MANVKCDVLYLHDKLDGGRNELHLRVVRWNGGEAQLEKREIYEKDGEERCGKAKGLSKADLLDFLGVTIEELRSIGANESALKALEGEQIDG